MAEKKLLIGSETISTLLHYMEFVTTRLRKDYKFIFPIFRGQGDANLEPKPKIDRDEFIMFRGTAGETRMTHERVIMREFKKMIRPYLTVRPENEWEWLATAQHYGLSTRLLDWTRNPLVALYFAVEKKEKTGDGAVWCYFCLGQTTEKCPDPFKIKKVVLLEPPHISPRIIAQNSCMTAHPDGATLSSRYWQGYIAKAIIPADIKPGMKDILADELGIHCASLFPDGDGIANFLNYTYSEHIH